MFIGDQQGDASIITQAYRLGLPLAKYTIHKPYPDVTDITSDEVLFVITTRLQCTSCFKHLLIPALPLECPGQGRGGHACG